MGKERREKEKRKEKKKLESNACMYEKGKTFGSNKSIVCILQVLTQGTDRPPQFPSPLKEQKEERKKEQKKERKKERKERERKRNGMIFKLCQCAIMMKLAETFNQPQVQGAYPAVDLAHRPWAEHDEEAEGNPTGWEFWLLMAYHAKPIYDKAHVPHTAILNWKRPSPVFFCYNEMLTNNYICQIVWTEFEKCKSFQLLRRHIPSDTTCQHLGASFPSIIVLASGAGG